MRDGKSSDKKKEKEEEKNKGDSANRTARHEWRQNKRNINR